MPRTARVKSSESIYHTMVRSVGDIDLYKNSDDKNKYLELIKKYQIKFGYKVYAYCIMDNHSHILIDSNGADISKVMHGINQSYAQYFNRKYKRRGHVFGDRFKSQIIKDEKYLVNLSAYIHNNPKDLKNFKDKPENYKFSSLGIYLGNNEDNFDILDINFILQLFGSLLKESRGNYIKLVHKSDDHNVKQSVEFEEAKADYRSERVIIGRNHTPKDIIDFVSKYTCLNKNEIVIKYNRNSIESKALIVLLMRRFCDFKIKEICSAIGNITQSRVSILCNLGIKLIVENEKYKNIINNFEKSVVSY